MKFLGFVLIALACICGYPTVDGEMVGLTAGMSSSNLAAYTLTGLKQDVPAEIKPKPADPKPIFPNRPHIFRDGTQGTGMVDPNYVPETAPEVKQPVQQTNCANCQTYQPRFRIFRR
jgi:hypothetical protein